MIYSSSDDYDGTGWFSKKLGHLNISLYIFQRMNRLNDITLCILISNIWY